MRSRLLTGLALLTVASALAAVAATAATAGTGGVRIERVDRSEFPKVAVTVVGPSASVLAQMQVYENGQLAAHVRVPNPKAPAAIALAIDTSDSMHGRPLADATAAAAEFARRQPPNDLLAVYGFDNRPYVVSQLGAGAGTAAGGLASLHTGGPVGTAIFGAVRRVASDLSGAGATRRVLILLTDGQSFRDTSTLAAAIGAARSAHVTIYPVAIVTPLLDRSALNRLAQSTGGRLSLAQNSGQLARIYRAISRALGDTVTLTYRSLVAPGTPITLAVTVPGAARSLFHTSAPGKAPAARPAAGPGMVLPTSFAARIALVAGGMLTLLLVCLIAVRVRSPFG